MNRDDFSEKTKQVIASRVGYKCCYAGCNIETQGPHSNENKRVTIGEAAHICAAAPGGPRYDETMTPAERKSASNGIWMCSTHARLIDKDVARHPVELLRKWKSDAEWRQAQIQSGMQYMEGSDYRLQDTLIQLNNSIRQLYEQADYVNTYYEHNFQRFENIQGGIEQELMQHSELYENNISAMHETLCVGISQLNSEITNAELLLEDELIEKLRRFYTCFLFSYEADAIGMYSTLAINLLNNFHIRHDEIVNLYNELLCDLKKLYQQ